MKTLIRVLWVALFVVAVSWLVDEIRRPPVLAQSYHSVQKGISTGTVPDNAVQISVDGAGAVGLQITGTFTGTVSFEGSLDCQTYVALNMHPLNSTVAASSATAVGAWSSNVGGVSCVQARMSSYTSGTAVVTLRKAPGNGIR